MPAGNVDLKEVALRLANRAHGRAEANIQSDLHLFLAAAPLDLGEGDIKDIELEAQVGKRRRIDVEIGFTVFEVKKDLRTGNVKVDALDDQLTDYVRTRTETLGQRYVGVLTDGAEWYLYQLVDDRLREVSHFELSPVSPDVEGLSVWLEGVLATTTDVNPTPKVIAERLGAASPSHDLDATQLAALYAANREQPTVKLKRELWAKLLTTAFGTNFDDTDTLFVEHTLLVLTAGIIGHAVVGYDPSDPTITPATLVSGGLFSQAQIGGVVEEDFFAWIIEVPGGAPFVQSLARRVARFDWQHVEHDVMKVLYESVISPDERHRLGEYYTPDWLADQMVTHVVTDPLHQRVLDPGCGSGTFLFWAVRRYLDAATAAGVRLDDAIRGVTGSVIGLDIHPVACTLARITYLLAIGAERLRSDARPPFAVPVYLGDSVQWNQQRRLLAAGSLTIPTTDEGQLFASDLRFPERLLDDTGRFDELVSELADKATQRRTGAAPRSLGATFRRFAIHPDEEEELTATFKVMCDLHDQGRDHIWGYYTRNLARPVWLARDAHRVDVLVGNPPWLAYRFMTPAMQAEFKALSQDRKLWQGAAVATHQDLSGLFVARCAQLYLRDRGRFGFVMPLAALSRRQFAGFRTGHFSTSTEQTIVEFDQPWDLHKVKPAFFPVPASVVFGTKRVQPESRGTIRLVDVVRATPLDMAAEVWSGRLPKANVTWSEAEPHISRESDDQRGEPAALSPYASRFGQGAVIAPRVLLVVEPQQRTPIGTGAGRRAVRSTRSPNEKKPWKFLASLEGVVESQFLRALYVGDTVVPYRIKLCPTAVIPWDGQRLLDVGDDRLDLFPGLADWWRRASEIWTSHHNGKLTLTGQVDYRRKLVQQFPIPEHRVVYSASGMYLAAARVTDRHAIVEHMLYWGATRSEEESLFLVAILNSFALTLAVRPLQARGEHNPRHFDKYIFQLPIPMYDHNNDRHRQLAALAREAEIIVAALELPTASFQAQRRAIRVALREAGVGLAIERIVIELLGLTLTEADVTAAADALPGSRPSR